MYIYDCYKTNQTKRKIKKKNQHTVIIVSMYKINQKKTTNNTHKVIIFHHQT